MYVHMHSILKYFVDLSLLFIIVAHNISEGAINFFFSSFFLC